MQQYLVSALRQNIEKSAELLKHWSKKLTDEYLRSKVSWIARFFGLCPLVKNTHRSCVEPVTRCTVYLLTLQPFADFQ